MILAQRVIDIKSSPTMVLFAKAKKLKAKGVDIIIFGTGEPDFDTPQNIKDASYGH